MDNLVCHFSTIWQEFLFDKSLNSLYYQTNKMNKIKRIGVVGAGQMGAGIAQVCAFFDYQVTLFDNDQDNLHHGVACIENKLMRGVKKGEWDEKKAQSSLEHLHSALKLQEISDCDLIIEAATENKEIKFAIFRELDSIAKAGAILATNTSSISITEIASVTQRPKLIVGMHFMNPVPVMKLVEGIKGLETSDQTFEVVQKLAQSLGKTFIKVNDVAGFAINRILLPTINEAIYAHYEGVASIEDIDSGMKLGANWPMGPF